MWFLLGGMESVQESGLLERWLYRTYHRGSAVGAFVRQRVRPGAWLLMGGGISSVLLGADFEKSIVVVLTLLMLGILGVGFGWAFFRRGQISAVREVPRTGAVGEELGYRVVVRNEGRTGLREAYLSEAGDDPRPGRWEFLNLREPGEEDRNVFDRFFCFYRWKWLVGKGGRWEGRGRSKVLRLEPGEVVEVGLSLIPKRRGVLRLDDLRLELPDPLGLFQRRRPTLNERAEIVIIPRRYRLPRIDMGGGSDLRVGGETASTVRGEGGEFLGLREYRAGDSLRTIHWKGWARTGRPIVKEYEEVRFPRFGLVLDRGLKGSGPDILEEVVSVAASFVSTMERESCLLDLMFVGEEPQVFTAGRGVAKPDRLMEVLAKVEGSDEGGYEALRRLVTRHAGDLTACVVIFSGWCEERKVFLEGLRAVGLDLRVYAVGAGEMSGEARLAGVRWLRWDRVQEDLMGG